MIAAIPENRANVNDLFTRQNATFHCLLNAGINGFHELAWNRTLRALVRELVTTLCVSGFQLYRDMSVLSAPAHLSYVLAFCRRVLANSFKVYDGGLFNLEGNSKLTHKAVANHFQM